jgi:hypothetical protein
MDILRVEAVDKRLLEHNAWQQQPRSFDLCFLTHTGSCKNQNLGKDHSNSSSPTNMPLDVQRNHTLECPGTFCRMLRRETTWACPWGKASPSCDMEICGKPAWLWGFQIWFILLYYIWDWTEKRPWDLSGKTWAYYPWLIHQQRWLTMAGFERNHFPVAMRLAWIVKRLSMTLLEGCIIIMSGLQALPGQDIALTLQSS